MADEKSSVGIIISVAIAVLIGVVLISIIASESQKVTTLTLVTESVNLASNGLRNSTNNISGLNGWANESYTLKKAYAASDWRSEDSDCTLPTPLFFGNATATVGVFVKDTDYQFFANNGTIRMIPMTTTEKAGNLTTITYQYCSNEYLESSWGRTVLNMTPGFFALAILMGAAFVIFYILRKEGVDID